MLREQEERKHTDEGEEDVGGCKKVNFSSTIPFKMENQMATEACRCLDT